MTYLYQLLKRNLIQEIKQPGLHQVMGHIPSVVDEGNLIRIDGTYIIEKNFITSVKAEGKTVHIEYSNGKWMEFVLSHEENLSISGLSNNGRKLGRPKRSKTKLPPTH